MLNPTRSNRMKSSPRSLLIGLFLSLVTSSLASAAAPLSHPAPAGFIANQGQLEGPARLYAKTPDCAAYFEPQSVMLDRAPNAHSRRGVAIRVTFPASHGAAALEAVAPRPDQANVFSGTDRSRWRTALPTYDQVRYHSISDGADLVYHLVDGQLEYDVLLAPGAELSRVALRYRGADRLEIDHDGALRIHTAAGVLYEKAPVLYQDRDGARVAIAGGYRLSGRDQIGFWAGNYDRSQPLVVDPGVAWSTYLGGSGTDEGYGVATDASGDVYVVGCTGSTNYPTSTGVYQTVKAAGVDVVVTKLRGNGTSVLWSTCIGGAADDIGRGIAVDASGNIYITGSTGSANFPTTTGAYQRTLAAGVYDGFVTKLSASGSSLIYSTLVGASWDDYPRGIAVDAGGAVTIAGFTNSIDYPTTAGAVKATRTPSMFDGADGFVTKLNAAGSAIVYSTYLGTNGGTDEIFALALDASGRANVTGWTASSSYPTTAGAFSRVAAGMHDVFVTRLNATGTGYVFSTFLDGTGYDEAYGIAVGPDDGVYVAGRTTSLDFPTTSGAFQRTLSSANYYDAFVTKLVSSGSALGYSTYVGGGGNDCANAVAVSSSGYAGVTGTTDAVNFPVTSGALGTSSAGGIDAFGLALNPTGSQLTYSGYMGGSGTESGYGVAIRPSGHVVIVGSTNSTNFPAVSAVDPTQNSSGMNDCFASDVDMGITTGSAGVVDQLLSLQLSAASPNPFRTGTALNYTLTSRTRVAARVIDIQGRVVRVLEDAEMDPGHHTLTWDGHDNFGGDVGAGVYHIEFATSEGRSARSVVRLR
jgi:Beta-propeller repeat/FlgD Ig-like domain